MFAIEKSLNMITSHIEKPTRLRNGDMLILTKNSAGTNAVSKAKELVGIAEITVTGLLNNSKGTVFHRDLMTYSEEEIIENLKSQGVIETKRTMR